MKLKFLRGLFVLACATLYQSADAYDFKFGGIYYNILSKSGRTVEVTCLSESEGGYSRFVEIPSNVTYNGVVYTVAAIGGKAFKECNPYSSNSGEIKAITIPKTIKSIGSEAFRNCYVHELQVLDIAAWCNVSCDDSPFMVGAGLFFEGRKVNNLIIPSGVTSISKGVFCGCKQLETVSIPQGVVSIGNGAFRFCERIKSLSLPSSVAYIGRYAFEDCKNLTTLKITNPNIRFEENAFANCKSLTTLIIPNDMQIDVDAFFSKCGVKKGCYTVKRIGNTPLTPLHETENSLVDENNIEDIITSTFIKNIQKYRELNSFHDSLACVLRDGKYGYINLKGEEVIPCIYTYAQDFSNGVACVTINGNEYFIDTKGKTTSPKYSSTKQKQSLILKQHNKKYGYVDSIGNVVIPYKYDGAKDFSEGLAAVRNITYIDGAEVFSAIDDEVDWGFINEKGKIVIPFKYSLPKDERALFSEGVVIVKKSGRFGYIDREGKQITPCKYTVARPFSNGVAYVERDGYKGYIDKNGIEARLAEEKRIAVQKTAEERARKEELERARKEELERQRKEQERLRFEKLKVEAYANDPIIKGLSLFDQDDKTSGIFDYKMYIEEPNTYEKPKIREILLLFFSNKNTKELYKEFWGYVNNGESKKEHEHFVEEKFDKVLPNIINFLNDFSIVDADGHTYTFKNETTPRALKQDNEGRLRYEIDGSYRNGCILRPVLYGGNVGQLTIGNVNLGIFPFLQIEHSNGENLYYCKFTLPYSSSYSIIAKGKKRKGDIVHYSTFWRLSNEVDQRAKEQRKRLIQQKRK